MIRQDRPGMSVRQMCIKVGKSPPFSGRKMFPIFACDKDSMQTTYTFPGM